MKCKLCLHPRRSEIEASLVGGASHRETARRFGLSRAGCSRHQAHMPESLFQRKLSLVGEAMQQAFDAAVEVLHSRKREGKDASTLEAAAQVLRLGEPLLRRMEEREKAKKEESRPDLIRGILEMMPTIEPALVVGDPELLREVLQQAGPLLLLESLKLKLRLQSTLRRQAAEACAEGTIGGFEHGQRAEALAAFEAEHAAVRTKFFPEPAVPPEPPLSPEEQARVVPFEPDRRA